MGQQMRQHPSSRVRPLINDQRDLCDFALERPYENIGQSLIVHIDCFDWLASIKENSLHAIVTDPPYSVHEYNIDQLEKRENGKGGIWRIPPSFDGHRRSPLPRFTAYNRKELESIRRFFREWGTLVIRTLRPGGHVLIASNAIMSQMIFSSLVEGGLEFRGEIIRLVRTLRGGDRPKNAESEFPDVNSLPRGCYEPWGVLRKPLLPGMKVSDCLREFGTGGLRRQSNGLPFNDVIISARTPQCERKIANHPSLKPQSFLRRIVYAALPLGEGIIADPFMGSGSTVAAAEAMGIRCIGVERYTDYYKMARMSISKLAAIKLQDGDQAVFPF